MFIHLIILSIIIGYILKGRLSNFEYVELKGSYLIAVGFLIEFGIVMAMRKSIITSGYLTFSMNLLMYILIFIFVYLNRKNVFLLIVGLGAFLNAIVIFLNGGTMPVSAKAYEAAGLTCTVNNEGLYNLIDGSTRLWILGDVIPYTIIGKFVISIGDIVIAVGLMLFIINGMRKRSS